MPNANHKQRGFTFIEVAVSLFVISTVILIYAATSKTAVLNRNAKHQQLANRIAVSAMENLRATAFDSLPASGPLANTLLSDLPAGEGSVNISDVDAGTKQVTVTVSWLEAGSYNPHSVILTTLKTKQGL